MSNKECRALVGITRALARSRYTDLLDQPIGSVAWKNRRRSSTAARVIFTSTRDCEHRYYSMS